MFENGVLLAYTKQHHWLSTEMHGDRILTVSSLVFMADVGHETNDVIRLKLLKCLENAACTLQVGVSESSYEGVHDIKRRRLCSC